MDPKNPFKVASTKILGSENRLFRNAADPNSARAGPQLKIFSFPALAGNRDHGRGASVNAGEKETDGDHSRNYVGQALNHIGPDYRLDPAPGDIENADDRKQQNGRQDRPADQDAHRQTSRHQPDAGSQTDA